MIRYNPTLCNKCFIFPCVCGNQYKTLSTEQLKTLHSNITSLLNMESRTSSLKELLSSSDMETLPKKFINHLFNQKSTNEVSVLWDKLKDSSLLWKSCFAMFLSRYSPSNSTRSYYNFIVDIVSTFDMRHNDALSQVLLAAASGTLDVNIPLILSFTDTFIEKIEDPDTEYVKSYVIPCARIACYKPGQPIMDLVKGIGQVIAAISGLPNDIDILSIIDNTSIDIEDQMVFVDEKICGLIHDNLSGDFQGLTLV